MPCLRDRIHQQLSRRFEQIREESPAPLPHHMFDPVFKHLDAIIDVISGIRDFSTEPYLDRIRAVVCVECTSRPDASCALREAEKCGLDAYFPVIVGIIEREFKTDVDVE